MTHLGQRLSALIDGELDRSERERVLVHLTGCDSCRDEVAALRMLKRRTSALGDVGSGAGAGLTGRLLELSALASMRAREEADQQAPGSGSGRPVGGLPAAAPAARSSGQAGTSWPARWRSSWRASAPPR